MHQVTQGHTAEHTPSPIVIACRFIDIGAEAKTLAKALQARDECRLQPTKRDAKHVLRSCYWRRCRSN